MKFAMITEEESPLWHSYLYQLQQEAPRPNPVLSDTPEDRPPQFGDEYHGLISREHGDLLCKDEGDFLVRESMNEVGRYTLVLRLLGAVKNFKLYYDSGQFFVGDKRFDSLYELVEDGLITMYVEEKGRDYIQNMSNDRSVYSSLSKTKRLLTNQFPAHVNGRDAGNSPRRTASVRVGSSQSPRYAHNGRNTENAALPYTHYLDSKKEYFDPTAYHAQSGYAVEPNTSSLEEQFAANMLQDNNYYMQQQQTTPHVAYYNPHQIGGSIMQMLTNSRDRQDHPYDSGAHFAESHGAKKSLTPTSSDERKRPKAKKAATDRAVAQHNSYYQHGHHLSESAMYDQGYHSGHVRSVSNGSSSNTDSEGRRRPHVPPRTRVPSHLKNRPFHQSAPSNSPGRSPQRPAMRRNNSDLGSAMSQSSILSQLARNNIARANCVTAAEGVTVSHTQLPLADESVEKIYLDANDNQLVVSTVVNKSANDISSRRQNSDFDSSSGSDVFSAKTFQQLKMLHKRLEDDDDMSKEAQDEVTTLRDRPRPQARLARSHTTAGNLVPTVRPHSGGKAYPRPAPRDLHYRQRSEPVELFLHNAPNHGSNSNHHYGGQPDRLQQHPVARQRDFYPIHDQSDLRGPSSGSCDSSLSNLSSSGNAQASESYFKRPADSISHVSSEEWTGEERESSPSPHNTAARSCSSDDNSLPKTGLLSQLRRQNGVTDDHPESRDKITALQGQSPQLMRHLQAQAIANSMQAACVPPPEVLSGTKPRRKHTTNYSDPKTRNYSETSSEDGTMKTPPHSHKPLQRRATTGSASPHNNVSKLNGFSPVKAPSKKPAQRSNSGPSPRKGKKSPARDSSPHNLARRIHHQRSLSSPRSDGPYYDKEHVFKSHTYRGLQWCEYCGNFMWGIIQQGMQCRDCGLNVHKQCSKLVPGDCQPALKHVKTVFGIDLTALVKLHGTERPIVVDKCIAEIERRGLTSEGLYRVSGFHDDVQRLKIAFDRYGAEVDLSSYDDINIVAGGLKLYLRELPVPLIPFNLYSRFINAAKLSFSDGKLEAIRTALDVMPPAHLQTLKHIMMHLGRVCDREDNQMNAQNLGIVFGPTMLRPPEKSGQARYSLDDTQYQKEIVQTLVQSRHELFGFAKMDAPMRETHNL